MESCLGFIQLLFCGTVRQHKANKAPPKETEKDMVKIRVGFEGKDTLFSTENLNVKTTFGQYAVLLDYVSNKIVPLHSSGSVMEPLEARRRYVVVLNTLGSSSDKWEDLRKLHKGGNRKHRKHASGKHSSKRKRSTSGTSRSASRTSISKPSERNTASEEVKKPLLVQKDEEEEDEDDSEEEEEELENEKKQQEDIPATNFAAISFGVSDSPNSMDSMINLTREVLAY